MAYRQILAALVMAALSAGEALAGEPGGTPDALYFSEAAVGGAAAMAAFVAGYAVGGDPKTNAGTTRDKLSVAVYGGAPLASALAVFLVGENEGVRADNRGGSLMATVAVSYGASIAAAGVAYALTQDDKRAGAVTAGLYATLPVAFLNAYIYNRVKEPYFAPVPGYSLRVAPYTSITTAAGPSRKPLPMLGLLITF